MTVHLKLMRLLVSLLALTLVLSGCAMLQPTRLPTLATRSGVAERQVEVVSVDHQVVAELPVEAEQAAGQPLAGRAFAQLLSEKSQDAVGRQVRLGAVDRGQGDALRLDVRDQLLAHHRLADAARAIDVEQLICRAAGDQVVEQPDLSLAVNDKEAT